jgi:hypothetical protein
VTTPQSQPANGRRAGRQSQSLQAKAQALHRLQQASLAQLNADQSDALRTRVSDHLRRQGHFATTADLIDLIITRYPDCPKFASLLVDRLMAGDEALADALRSEGI